MELGTFTPQVNGDRLAASDAVNEPLIVSVKETRSGIKTQYTPDGGDGVTVDVAKIATNEVFVNVLWMNAQIFDQLKSYLGQMLPVKIVWTPSQRGGNPYLMLEGLEGVELAAAQTWAQINDGRFEREAAQRAPAPPAQSSLAAPVAAPAAPGFVMGASTGPLPPRPTPPAQPPVPVPVEPALPPVRVTGTGVPTPPVTPAQTQELTPEMVALIQQIQAQQQTQ